MAQSTPAFSHPKLTATVRSRFLKLHAADRVNARRYLGEALGLKKSMRDEWALRILASTTATGQPAEKSVAPVEVNLLNRPVRRLFWDIEVSPDVVLSWRVGFKLNINPDSIIKERAIICICWKWEGDAKVHSLKWDNAQDDRAMIEEFLAVANSADELVAHHGDRFDLPWFKTRCLFHKLITPPDYKTVDTCSWAKRKFYFNSNKLDYIAGFLGLGKKLHTGYDLWKRIVLEKDAKALADMVTYCQMDVTLLEKVWARLSQTVQPKTHAGVLAGRDKWTSPYTGSKNVKTKRTRVTAAGTLSYQMQDLDGGSYYTISAKAHSEYLEAKKGDKTL